MDLPDMWQQAVRTTRIRRKRIASLETFDETHLPYILVCRHPKLEAQANVRQGRVDVARPKLFLPENSPQFEGFDFEQMAANENSIQTLMFVRGVKLPSFKFKNLQNCQLYDGTVDEAVRQYGQDLARTEDVLTGLITAEEDVWPLSLLFYVSLLVAKNLPKDIERLIEEFRGKSPL
ncbi:hypothetical protein HY522_04050 [bacterium]|nr:hypothetical protein [bacterium]